MVAVHFDGTADAWHKIRAGHVGGSEVASLFHVWRLPDGVEQVFHIFEQPADGLPLESLSPYLTGYRLWLQKAGLMAAEDLDEAERVQAGQHMEPAIAAWARERFSWGIRKVRRYIRHDSVAGWGASFDYEVHEAGASGAPVEIKNVDGLVFRDTWVAEDREIVSAPLHIALQVQAQIGAAGADHGWIVACVGGNKLYRGRVERHEPTQEMLAEAIAAFWSADGPPEWLATAEVAKEFFARGLKETTADLSGDAEMARCARRLMRWSRHVKKAEAIVDGLKGRIQVRMGEKTRASGDGWRATWPAVHRAEKLQPEKLIPAMDYRGGFTIKEA